MLQAYLAYGIPRSDLKFFALLQKVGSSYLAFVRYVTPFYERQNRFLTFCRHEV